ncbi:MAG: hypothetical protein LBR35_00290 [Rickettsiales bacterium]|jgi:hypothetical protein|nr:hypothetical protein [Rickettsiales bacterium]
MKALLLSFLTLFTITANAEPNINWGRIVYGINGSFKTFNLRVSNNIDDTISIYSFDNFPCFAIAGATSDTEYDVRKGSIVMMDIRCVLKPKTVTFGFKVNSKNKPSVFPKDSKIQGVMDCPVRAQDNNATSFIYEVNLQDCQERRIDENRFFTNY